MKIFLGNGIIPGGMGTEVKNLVLTDESIDFGEEMYGWITYGDLYTSAWHDGEFQEIYTDKERTIEEYGESREEVEEFAEYKKIWQKTFDENCTVQDIREYLENMGLEDIDVDNIKEIRERDRFYLVGEVI